MKHSQQQTEYEVTREPAAPADPVVFSSMGSQSRDALRAQGYAVEWHDYPMQHEVCAEDLVVIGRALGSVPLGISVLLAALGA